MRKVESAGNNMGNGETYDKFVVGGEPILGEGRYEDSKYCMGQNKYSGNCGVIYKDLTRNTADDDAAESGYQHMADEDISGEEGEGSGKGGKS